MYRKIKFIVLLSFTIVTTGYMLYAKETWFVSVLEKYSEGTRKNISSQADLIIEGAFIDVKIMEGSTAISAFAKVPSSFDNQQEMQMDLPFVISFNVDKVIKGDYQGDKFNILIHSPSAQFGIDFEKPNASSGKKFRIYTKKAQIYRILIGQELLDTPKK